jgi:hypothetical protein
MFGGFWATAQDGFRFTSPRILRPEPALGDLDLAADGAISQETQLAQQTAIPAFAAFSTWASNAVIAA